MIFYSERETGGRSVTTTELLKIDKRKAFTIDHYRCVERYQEVGGKKFKERDLLHSPRENVQKVSKANRFPAAKQTVSAFTS